MSQSHCGCCYCYCCQYTPCYQACAPQPVCIYQYHVPVQPVCIQEPVPRIVIRQGPSYRETIRPKSMQYARDRQPSPSSTQDAVVRVAGGYKVLDKDGGANDSLFYGRGMPIDVDQRINRMHRDFWPRPSHDDLSSPEWPGTELSHRRSRPSSARRHVTRNEDHRAYKRSSWTDKQEWYGPFGGPFYSS